MGYELSTFLPLPTKFQAHFVIRSSAVPAGVARRNLGAWSVVASVRSFSFRGPQSSFRDCCCHKG